MKKIIKKEKLIILISIVIIIVIIGLVIGINAVRVNIANGKYNSANNNSSNGNLLPEYIKAGITLGGVTGTLEDLDTSDATATADDILWGKTAYVDGKKITGTKPRTIDILQVGDYVAYTPDTTTSNYSLSSDYSGYSSSQTINRENLTWQVLSKNDDGTVDLISSAPTSGTIGLGGALGYNNGVYLLNDISAKLYSNSKLGVTARSINIEDIEKNMTEAGLKNIHSYSGWGVAEASYYADYPNLYAKENGSGINTTITKNDGIGPSDSYYTSPTRETSSRAQYLTITKTYYKTSMTRNDYEISKFYDLIHDEKGTYWIASRCVGQNYDWPFFGFRVVKDDYLQAYDLYTKVSSYSLEYYLRPVVSLKANIKIGLGDGKKADTAYQIIN